MKNNTLLVLVIVIICLGVGLYAMSTPKTVPVEKTDTVQQSDKNVENIPVATPNEKPAEQPKVVGGNKDSHGCVLGGGYSWDTELGKCMRPWERLSALFAGTTWKLISNDKNVSENVYFKIENGTISGRACNSFSGKVSINDKNSTITVSSVMSTLMACTDSNISKAESDMLALLSDTVSVSLDEYGNANLVLKKGAQSLSFSKQN